METLDKLKIMQRLFDAKKIPIEKIYYIVHSDYPTYLDLCQTMAFIFEEKMFFTDEFLAAMQKLRKKKSPEKKAKRGRIVDDSEANEETHKFLAKNGIYL